MKTPADYYDGESSARRQVELRLVVNHIEISGEGLERRWPVRKAQVDAPLAGIRRALYLPDGGKLIFDDDDFARAVAEQQNQGGFFRGVHRWENSLKLAFVALGLIIALVVGFIQFGLPTLAEQAAYAIPPGTETQLGRESLQFLDRALFAPSQLGPERRAELVLLFDQVVTSLDATERPYRLELRKSPRIGANAFALPGGTIIMTDELVALAGQDEEIAAVLAHEVGHVRHRHAMRQVIQNSTVGLLVATLTGDVFSASSLAAAIPTMLVDAKFSRDMEREADDVALEYLHLQGQSTKHFAAILKSLEEAFAEKRGEKREEGRISGYFASHPATRERIARLKEQD